MTAKRAVRLHVFLVGSVVWHMMFDQGLAFQHACRCGYMEIVGFLLMNGRADPTADDNAAIRWSSTKGHADVVRLLLADGRVDPRAKDNQAIRISSADGHT
ncbi:hypothetical protein LCGC14_1778230, partial [marine sediment metagenome]